MRAHRRRQVPVFLILIATAVGWLAFQHNHDATIAADETDATPPKTASVDPLPPEPTFSMPPIGNYAEIVERPIFIQGRRPPAGETAAITVEPTVVPFDLALIGVIGPDQERVALLKPEKGGDVIKMTKGEKFNGWTLIDIQPDRVVLERGEETRTLELLFETAAPRPKPTRRDRRNRRNRQQQNQLQNQGQDETVTQNQNRAQQRRQRRQQNQSNE